MARPFNDNHPFKPANLCMLTAHTCRHLPPKKWPPSHNQSCFTAILAHTVSFRRHRILLRSNKTVSQPRYLQTVHHSPRRIRHPRDDNINDDQPHAFPSHLNRNPGEGNNETTQRPVESIQTQKYRVDHIVKHVRKCQNLKNVVQWYGYNLHEDKTEPSEHIPRHFIDRYWKWVKRKNNIFA